MASKVMMKVENADKDTVHYNAEEALGCVQLCVRISNVTAPVDKKTIVLVISMTICSHMELLASALSAGEVFSYTSSAAVTNVPIAQPAPVCMAMHTGHMIAATIFKGLGMAGRTFLGCLLDIL